MFVTNIGVFYFVYVLAIGFESETFNSKSFKCRNFDHHYPIRPHKNTFETNMKIRIYIKL